MRRWLPALVLAIAAAEGSAAGDEDGATVAAGPGGFEIRGSGDEFRIRLGGYLQLDERHFVDEIPGAASGFLARRIRCVAEGTVHRHATFRVMPDFGGGATVLRDAWIGLRFSSRVRLQVGRFKAVGYEQTLSATNLLFGERALPTNLVPAWDQGLELQGDAPGGFAWAVGVFNGVPDGASSDQDVTNDKDVTARVSIRPGHGLGLGLAATAGREEGTAAAPALASYKSPGQQTFFRYLSDGTPAGTTVADGTRRRVAPWAAFHGGRLAMVAEHVTSRQEVRRGADDAEIRVRAEQLALGVMLSDDETTSGRISPRRPFRDGGAGAWQVVARVARQRIDRDAFPRFADRTRSAQETVSRGVGLNGYLSRGVRTLLDWETTRFEGGAARGDRADENVLLARLQIAF